MNYKNIHDSIINRAKNRILVIYSEKHHIIPKSLGGNNTKENLVRLTAKEHYIIHRLLIKIYPESRKLVYAFWRMINDRKEKRYKASPRIYEQMRILAAKDLRERFNNAPPESEIRRRQGISKNNKKPKSFEHAQKIRNAKKGDKNPMYGKTGKNHHCSKPILQFDLTGKFIKEWENAGVAEKELELRHTALNAVVKTKNKIRLGFIWKYKENTI